MLSPTGDQVDSDASGTFRFSHLAAGPYTVAAAKNGFEEDDGTYVELSASRADLVVRLTPLASIRGQVTDDEGEPVDGVVVPALRSRVEHGLRRYELAARPRPTNRGQYRIPWLAAGRYLVQAAGREQHIFAGESEPAPKSHEAFAPVYFGGSHDRASASILPL